MSFNIFHFLFSHSRLFLVASLLGCVLIWTSFASPRLLRTSSWTFWISSGAPRWDVCPVSFAWKHRFWGHIVVLEALYALYDSMYTLWHYTAPRDVDCFLPQQTGSQMLTRYDEFYLRHALRYEQVNASRNRKVIELQHSPSSGDFRHGYVALPHCPMLWFSASHVKPT